MIKIEFKGDCMGVRLVPRGPDDDHVCFEVLIEDDECWHKKMNVSSAWLDELIEVLQRAKACCDYLPKDPDGRGVMFK